MFWKLRSKFYSWLEAEVEHKHCTDCGISIRPYHDQHHMCAHCYVSAIAKPNRDKHGKFAPKVRPA